MYYDVDLLLYKNWGKKSLKIRKE